MREPKEPKVSKWPFFLGDAVLLGAAYFIYLQSKLPMGVWPMAFVVVCVAGGAWLGVMPFLLEYRLAMKLAETEALTGVAAQLKNLETLAAQISGATACWQTAHQEAEKVAAIAKSMGERMSAELKGFTEFMQKANDGEKATLRLEAEKLKRGEGDWIQVLVRMLDHVYALHAGALHSGQPQLIGQLNNFQTACRDAARRVGLVPFAPASAEPYDQERHQLLNGEGPPPAGGTVAETVATGYTFQGRLLRPALVRLGKSPMAEPTEQLLTKPESDLETAQSRLAFGQETSATSESFQGQVGKEIHPIDRNRRG